MSACGSLKGEEKLHGKNEELIPGLQDEIILEHITPKLPWRVFHVLSSVSRGWLNVIRNHQVYKARLRSNGLDTLALVLFSRQDGIRSIALYSTRDNSWVQLPPVPHLDGGVPLCCQCLSLDGKVYVMGGGTEDLGGLSAATVYMLDVAGQRKWKTCARMREPRARFASGVMNGKIYVFGGASSHDPVCGSEVYDPKEDTWSPIRPLSTLRISPRAEIVKEEFFLHDGWILDRDYYESTENALRHPYDDNKSYIVKLDMLDVYNPGDDKWRPFNPFGVGSQEVNRPRGFVGPHVFFGAGGDLYAIDQFHIHALDRVKENSWARLHSFSFREAIEWPCIVPFAVLAVGDELLVIVSIQDILLRAEEFFLVQSRGFTSKTEEIAWRRVQFPPFFADALHWYKFDVMHSIQL